MISFIKHIREDGLVEYRHPDYETLVAQPITPPPESDRLIIPQDELNAYRASEYQRQRVAEYPPITDYIDGVVKGDQAQIDAYIAACLAVKAKYPKPD